MAVTPERTARSRRSQRKINRWADFHKCMSLSMASDVTFTQKFQGQGFKQP